MSGHSDWLKDNFANLLIAIVGVGGAFLGAYYGSSAQMELWKREKQFTSSHELIGKRIEIIGGIVKSNVAAQRVSILMQTIGLARISHTSEAIARRYPEFESEIKVLQEFGSCTEGNSLFFALPIRYRACAPSI